MADANDIVNNALNGDADEPSRYVDWLGKKTDMGNAGQIRFGFYIHSTDEEMLKQNAQESGITTDEDFWAAISNDSAWLEENAANIARKFGLYVQGEGHGEDGAYVSSAWISASLPFEKQVEVAKKILALEGDLPSTTDGTYWRFFPGSETELYRDVSELGRQLLDVTVEFSGAEALTEWLKLNIVENAEDVDDPASFVQHFVPRLKGNLNVDFHAIKPNFPDVPNYFYRANVDGLILFRYQNDSEMRDLLYRMKYNEGSDLFPKTYCYLVPNPRGHILARDFLEQAGADAETMALIAKTNAPIYFYIPVDEFNNYLRLVHPKVKLRESAVSEAEDVDDPKGYLDKVTGWIDTFTSAGMTYDESREHQYWKKYRFGDFNYWVYLHIRTPLWLMVVRNDHISGTERFNLHFSFIDRDKQQLVTVFKAVDHLLTKAQTRARPDNVQMVDAEIHDLERANYRDRQMKNSGRRKLAEGVDDPEVQHYLDQVSPEPCFACGADLTQPHTVTRTYISKLPQYPDLKLEGHYDPATGFFEADDKPPLEFWQSISHCDLPEDCDVCKQCGKSTAKPDSQRNESVDEPEASPETYLSQIHDVQDITHDIQNYGMFVNRIEHWGKWVILSGGAYWATLHGQDDDPPLKADFFRAQLEKFMASLGITQFHIKAGQTGAANEHVWFQLGVPKSQLTPHSWEEFKRNTTGWPNEPHSTWLPENEIDDLKADTLRLMAHAPLRYAELRNWRPYIHHEYDCYYAVFIVPVFTHTGRLSKAHSYLGWVRMKNNSYNDPPTWEQEVEAVTRLLLPGTPLLPGFYPEKLKRRGFQIGMPYDPYRKKFYTLDVQEALDPDDPALNVERHTVDLDLPAIMARLGFKSVVYKHLNREHWEKVVGPRVWRVEVNAAAPQATVTSRAAFGTPENWIEPTEDTIPVNKLEAVLGFFDKPADAPEEEVDESVEATDPDDPSVNVERHMAAMDAGKILPKLGFSERLPSWNCADKEYKWWEKFDNRTGFKWTVIRKSEDEPQIMEVSIYRMKADPAHTRQYTDWEQIGGFHTHVGDLARKLKRAMRMKWGVKGDDRFWGRNVRALDATQEALGVPIPPEDDPEANVERFAQHIEKTEQTAQWKLDSVISRAEDDFALQVERRGINNAEAADQLVGEIAYKWATDFHYENGSEEYDWLVSALNNKAGEMFPGDWADYPVQEGAEDVTDWTEFLSVAVEAGLLSQKAAERYQRSQNPEANEKLYAWFIEMDEASQNDDTAGVNAALRQIASLVRSTNMRYGSAIRDFMKDVPLDEAQADPRILNLIKATTKHFGHEFMSGDCGNFAIALVRFLTEKGIPASYLVEYGSHYEMFDHVAVLVNGVAYDGEGVYRKKRGKGYDEWKKEDYDIEYEEFQNDDNSVDAIAKYTDSDAIFAHGSDADKTLEFMRTLPFGTLGEADEGDPERYLKSLPIPVKATCIEDHMVDGERLQAQFDAAEWFEQATLQQLIILAKNEFQSCYEADAVGEYFFDTQLKDWHESYRGDGFEVYVDESDAKRWIEHNRPDWYPYFWPGEVQIKEGIDDPSPELMQDAFDMPTILKRMGYFEAKSTPPAWIRTFKEPTLQQITVEVKRRGLGMEQNPHDALWDITLYQNKYDQEKGRYVSEPIVYRYGRTNVNIERVLKMIHARIDTNNLRGLSNAVDEALELPPEDEPEQFVKHMETDWRKLLEKYGFNQSSSFYSDAYQRVYPDKVWGVAHPCVVSASPNWYTYDEFIRHNWPADVPDECTQLDNDERDCLDREDTNLCLGCQTYMRLTREFNHHDFNKDHNFPNYITIAIRERFSRNFPLAKLEPFLRRFTKAADAIVGTETIEHGLAYLLTEAAKRIEKEINETAPEAPDPDDPSMVLNAHTQGMGELMPGEPVAIKSHTHGKLEADLQALGFETSWVAGRSVVLGEPFVPSFWSKHYASPSGSARILFVKILTKEGGAAVALHLRTRSMPIPIELKPRSLDHLLTIVRDTDTVMQQAAAENWPKDQEREAMLDTLDQHRKWCNEALDEPAVPEKQPAPPQPDVDDPVDVLKAHEHGLLEGELNRLAFEPVFNHAITHLYGRPLIDYWTKEYKAADGTLHGLYLYFLSSHRPMLRANNWNTLTKAWYQRGKEWPTDAVGKTEAHFCAIIRDLDGAMTRSAADSLTPEQEHEAVEAVLKHHRQWYDDAVQSLGAQGQITGRMGPGQPA